MFYTALQNHVLENLGFEIPEKTEEKGADRFAKELLLPCK